MLKKAYLQSKNVILFIGSHAMVVFKNMSVKLIESLSPDLSNCTVFNDHIMLFTLPDEATDSTIVTKELNFHNGVYNNVKILDKIDKWAQL